MIKNLLAIYGAWVILCTIITKKVKNEKNKRYLAVILKIARIFSTIKPEIKKSKKK